MVQINEVVPSRFREGDLISIRGFGFSPTFGANDVAIDGIPEPLQFESDTEIQLFVPPGVSTEQYVSIVVFRNDTLDNDGTQGWSKAPLDDLREGLVDTPGQIPGAQEAADPTPVADVPQAQDYERMVAKILWLLLAAANGGGPGYLFATDGSAIVPRLNGAAGEVLHADPADPSGTGLAWQSVARALTLDWGRKTLAANAALTLLVAGGDGEVTVTTGAEHLAPATGSLYAVLVYFESDGSDTLDQVRVLVNAVVQHDSGAALGIASGSSYVAAISVAVTAGVDKITVEASKAGVTGNARLSAKIGLR